MIIAIKFISCDKDALSGGILYIGLLIVVFYIATYRVKNISTIMNDYPTVL